MGYGEIQPPSRDDSAIARRGEAPAPLDEDRLQALLRLAVRATGASGGVLWAEGFADPKRVGRADGTRETRELRGTADKPLGRLELFEPENAGGVEHMVAPLLDALAAMNAPRPPSNDLLQTLALTTRLQAEVFDGRGDVASHRARDLMLETQLRVLATSAVQAAVEAATRNDRTDLPLAMRGLCERLADLSPRAIAFDRRVDDLRVCPARAQAIGIVLSEFTIAAMRDVFPKPTLDSVHLRLLGHADRGRERISMILHHAAESYDTSSWVGGAPHVAARIVEAVATGMAGLVSIDRATDEHGPGLRLHLVFDRPDDVERVGSADAADGTHIPDAPRTFDNRLGVHPGHPAMRKS